MSQRNISTIIVLFCVLTSACAPAQQAPSEATTAPSDEAQVSERGLPGTIALYRLFNARIGDHFYTTSAPERDKAASQMGYSNEGVCCQVFASAAPGTIPLYRLFNARTGDHFYTTSAPERDKAKAQYGYTDEGICCHVPTGQGSGTQPLYRLFKAVTGDHFYTTSAPERDQAKAQHGYTDEGVCCYVPTAQAALPPASAPALMKPGSLQINPQLKKVYLTIEEVSPAHPTQRDERISVGFTLTNWTDQVTSGKVLGYVDEGSIRLLPPQLGADGWPISGLRSMNSVTGGLTTAAALTLGKHTVTLRYVVERPEKVIGPGGRPAGGLPDIIAEVSQELEVTQPPQEAVSYARFPCNGDIALCDRQYDKVSYPTTHNSHSAKGDDCCTTPNQGRSLRQQLEDGIRGLMLDTHYPGPLATWLPRGVYLCHILCAFKSHRPLLDGLNDIRGFLETHPYDVVTIMFEAHVSAADTAQVFTEAGLDRYLYTYSSIVGWQTLQEMINSGRRLVVFAEVFPPDSDLSSAYPWYQDEWRFTWQNPYGGITPSDLSCAVERGNPKGMFTLNHFLTAVTWTSANWVNNNPYFLERVQRCQAERNQLPIFVTVDHYEVGDIFSVVRTLNGL